MTTTEKATEMYRASDPDYHPTRHALRIEKLAAVLANHPEARLEWCGDENTGRRYGRAKCRAGRCAKIGHTTYRQQVWAVWA